MNDQFLNQFRKKTTSQKPEVAKSVFFQLNFDDHGAFIQTVDDKSKPVAVSHLHYQGAVRNVLRTIEAIEEKKSLMIDWEKPSENLYLNEHDYLLWQLKQCDNFIGPDGRPIKFADGIGQIRLDITGKDDSLEAWVMLVFDGKAHESPQVLNEEHVMVDVVIYQIAPLGLNFGVLRNFQTLLHPDDLPKYFSLLYSYLDNVQVLWQEYRTELSQEIAVAEPSLIFEQVGGDNSLYMRVSQVLPKLGVDFLDQFEISKVAEPNELEQTIQVKQIEQQPIEEMISQMAKSIHSLAPKRGQGKSKTQAIQDENLFILPEEIASLFIYQELPKLLTTYKIYGTEKLKNYKVKAVQPSLNLNVGWGIDFLEGDVTLDVAGQTMNLFDVISQYNKNHYIALNDGTNAIINEGYIKKLERIFKKKKDKVAISFFDLPLVEELLADKEQNSTLKKSREVFEGFNNIAKSTAKLPKLNAKLRSYQKQGYLWLDYLHQIGLGGCLADDMGLGKTLQTIAILSKIYPKETKPSLIIMPRSLLFNWKNEVQKFNPTLSTYTYYQQNRNLEEACQANLIFTTYALVRNDIELFKEVSFYYVILDESQHIKNIASQAHKAVMLLQADHRLALSGTPIENNLGELYALFRFLNPAMFGSAERFGQHYASPIQKNNDEQVVRELRKKIYPFILRRLKKNVLKELPDKSEQILYVEMSAAQRKFYEQRRKFYQEAIDTQIATKGVQQAQFFIFQALTELRQIACIPEAKTDGKIASPKRELLVEQVLEAIANGHKVLIFANFLNAIELIGEQLDEQGVDYVSMTGSTRDRQRLVERFQEDPNCRAFLMTLKTGGLGLNLTAADTIFIFDPWWNKSAENQAIDRAHRMGQTKKVMCYKLIAQNSIEEKILQLQEKKSELFHSIISSDSSSIKSLSEEDIDFILG